VVEHLEELYRYLANQSVKRYGVHSPHNHLYVTANLMSLPKSSASKMPFGD